MKVLIVDDHDVVRRGVKQILAEEFDQIVFGEAANAKAALALVHKTSWDAVILDINMPGRSGLDVMKELKARRPKMQILVLSVQPEDQYAIPVLKAGASGYLCKDGASAELVNAFKTIIAGGKYVSPAVSKKLVASVGGARETAAHEKLSAREFQVLRLLTSGKSMGDMAQDLNLSPQSVSTYRARILKKLKMANNSQLIRYAIKMGW